MKTGPAGAAVRPGAALALTGAGAVATGYLWWHSTLSVSGPGGWLLGAGQICGLECGLDNGV